MCLAVPMELTDVSDEGTATAVLDGNRQTVDVSLIEDPAAGDFVIVHAGFAIEKLDRREADERLALFAEWAASGPDEVLR